MLVAEAEVMDRQGKTDSAIGVLPTVKWNKWAKPPCMEELKGLDLANARMKVETKAKRRATLSICGLGFLDVSELDTMTRGVDYFEVTPGGRMIKEVRPEPAQEVAKEKLAAHAEGKTIEVQQDPTREPETITVTPWEEGRVSLVGKEGLAIVRSEMSPELIEELDIKHKAKSNITHMPMSNFFKFKDRAEKCGVLCTLGEVSSRSAEEVAGVASPKEQGTAPAQGSLL